MSFAASSCILASIFVEVFGSERLVAQEFVEKAVVDGRADAQLHVGIKFEHRGGEQMRGRMAKHLDSVGIFCGEDGELGVVVERARKIDQFAIGARDQSFLREARRNLLAISAAVVPRGTSRVAPSGKVI